MVDQGRLDQFAVASARRAVQTLRERCIEGYVVFEGDPTCYEFTPVADFIYPAVHSALGKTAWPTTDESTANEAMKDALKVRQRARELSERAGYGSLVVGQLVDAQRAAQYALDTALGRN